MIGHIYVKGSTGRKKLRVKLTQPVQKDEGAIKRGYIVTPPSFIPQNTPQLEQKKEEEEEETFKEMMLLKESAITLPDVETEKPIRFEEEDIKVVNIKYPLIPSEPEKGEPVYAYAHIYFDKRYNELVYTVVEPPLDQSMRITLDNIKDYIQEKIDINFGQIRKADAEGYVTGIFNRAVKYFKIKSGVDVLRYYVVRDFIGLEMIEPLLQDKNIEDISCDGVNIPLYVYHRNPKLGSLRTNLEFRSRDDLDSFVNKLSERCGKTISIAKPLLDGTLPDGSRVQATLGSDIARNGSNFTIRMFTEKPLTPVDMIKFGTADLRVMAYMWFLIEHESSILISGGTASGKTSMLNVLSLFIKPQLKIVSIEDTAELRLPHAHWVPEVARSAITEEGQGQVDMYDLLRESLRQRPDYIIVGEVRGKEAYVLFQQMAVGHAGLATIHAENFSKLMDRLTTPPISLSPNLIENLDAMMVVKRVKQGRRYIRRVATVTEVLGYDSVKNRPVIGVVFKWDPLTDKFTAIGKSAALRKIANSAGLSEAQVKKEIEDRAKVLKWMIKKDIKDYRNVSAIVNLYYLSPDFLMRKIEADL